MIVKICYKYMLEKYVINAVEGMKIKVKIKAVIRNFKETLLDMICGIKEIRSNPIYGLGMLSSAMAIGISCIGAIVAYIIFCVQGGYQHQIEIIKNKDIDGAVTNGNVSIFYDGGMSIVLMLLIVIALLFAIIYFFMQETKKKKIIVLIDLIVAEWIVAFLVNDNISSRFLNLVGNDRGEYIVGAVLILCVAVIVLFWYIMMHSESKRMFRCLYKVAIATYIIIPILLYLLENIITSVIYIVSIVLIGALLFFVFTAILGSESSGNSGNAKSSSKSKSEESEKAPQPKVIEFSGNHKFYRGKGGYGISTPTDDCIYQDGELAQHSYVCTVDEYEKGKVIIMLNKKRVTGI